MNSPLARLPSLDLIRGFVAVARRMSITQAAEDLFLTQSAVSRQIKSLEDALGAPLFLRQHRALALTPEGERLFRLADAWLTQLAEQIDGLRNQQAAAPVTVTTTIGVTGLWLLPSLGRFQEQHPAIDVRVSSSNRVLDLQREGIDLAVRYCTAEHAPAGAHCLFKEQLVPVVSPALGLRGKPSAADIARLVLLEFDDVSRPWMQWPQWLQACGLGKAKPRGNLHFNQYDQVISAALAGHGMALGRVPLIARMLAGGQLIALAGMRVPVASDYAYWLVRSNAKPSLNARIFIDWLIEEARDTERVVAGLG